MCLIYNINPLTIDHSHKESDKKKNLIVGVYFFFKLNLNGKWITLLTYDFLL